VMIFSGVNGNLATQLDGSMVREHFGASVSGVGDIDSDGIADFIVGQPGLGPIHDLNYGGATIYSGQSMNTLHHFDGDEFFAEVGSGVAGIGDFDGDGVGDFAIGAELDSPMAVQQAGSITIYSGTTGRQLYCFIGETPFDSLGSIIDSGDVNNDGRADLVFSSSTANPGWQHDAGAAYVRGGFMPFLTTSTDHLDAGAGGTISFEIDFPSDAAGGFFALTASDVLSPSVFNGIVIPLDTSTSIWYQMLNSPPSSFSNTTGYLDVNGDATCTLVAAPHTFDFLAGSCVTFSALCKDSPNFNRYSSAAVTLDVRP